MTTNLIDSTFLRVRSTCALVESTLKWWQTEADVKLDKCTGLKYSLTHNNLHWQKVSTGLCRRGFYAEHTSKYRGRTSSCHQLSSHWWCVISGKILPFYRNLVVSFFKQSPDNDSRCCLLSHEKFSAPGSFCPSDLPVTWYWAWSALRYSLYVHIHLVFLIPNRSLHSLAHWEH